MPTAASLTSFLKSSNLDISGVVLQSPDLELGQQGLCFVSKVNKGRYN